MSAEDDARALDELRLWGRDPKLNALEALMWRTERPPANSWAGVVIQLLDSVPDWQRVYEAHEWTMRIVPRFTERIVEPTLPVGPPMWTLDADFDLRYHVRRVSLPAPGSMAQLLEFAQALALVPLDRNRPPWMVHLVEGLEGGRAAYILQAHHALMDGGGATQLFSRILGTGPASRGLPRPRHREVRPAFTRLAALKTDVSQLIKGLPSAVAKIGTLAADAAIHPGDALRYAQSAARVLTPPAAPLPESVRSGRRTAWRYGLLECELADLKKAGKAVGGTVNDAFVAAILGGLREYCKAQGGELPDIPISMPVSVRRPDDEMGGNRFTGAVFLAPSGIDDPAERIQAMRERVSAVRDEPAMDILGAITPLFNFVPTQVVTTLLQNMTVSAVVTTSSWPGLSEPKYIAGARVDRMFVFGPLPGTSMCAAMCTHVGTCCIAVNADGSVFTDTEALWSAMQRGLDQVLALG
ncbi:wax ester/triacylglycerol synthase domain-containing protein [Mycobacterium syngnathidarum]